MKLHLPSGLRTALLACMAAFAGVGTTITSATLAGGVFAVTIAGSVAMADAYSGTVNGNMLITKDSSGANKGIEDLSPEDTITFTNVSGWIDYNHTTWDAKLNLVAGTADDGSSTPGLTISDGSNSTYYLNGSVTGGGDFVIASKANSQHTIVFTGDLSKYTGAISITNNNNGNRTLDIKNETAEQRTVNASSITTATNRTYTVQIFGNNLVNSELDIKTLNIRNDSVTELTKGGSVATLSVDAAATLKLGADGALTLTTATFNGALENSGALTLNGAVTGLAGSVNNGTVVFGDNAVVTLDDSAFVAGENNTYSLSLFTGTGTMSGLTVDKLDGVLIAGRSWSFDANGTISYVLTSNILTYTGGTLSWRVGAEMTDGTFANDDIVTFTGNTTATLAEPISTAMMTVSENAALSLSAEGENKLTASILIVDGSLVLDGAILGEGTNMEGQGSLEIKGLDTENWTVMDPVLNGFAGDLTISEGKLQHTKNSVSTSLEQLNSITVKDSGSIWLHGAGYDGTFNIVDSTADAAVVVDGSALAGNTQLTGDATIRSQWYGNLNSTIRGTGNLTLISQSWDFNIRAHILTVGDVILGNGVEGSKAPISFKSESILGNTGDVYWNNGERLDLYGNIDCTGTLWIDGGTVNLGGGKANVARISFSEIDVDGAATLNLHQGTNNLSHLSINLHEGTTLKLEDSNTGTGTTVSDPYNKGLSFGTLTIDGSAKINYTWKGVMKFAALTGEGSITFEGSTRDNDPRATIFSSIRNYNGTISGEVSLHEVLVGSVHLDSGYQTIIDGVGLIKSNNFAKTGEGTLVMTGGLDVSESFTMNYEGSIFKDLEKTTAGLWVSSVADGTVLTYTGATGLLQLSSDAIGDSSLVLNLLGVADKLETGIDLGIASGVSKDLLMISGIEGGEFSQNAASGTWWYTGGTIQTDWDLNWGSSEIASAPSTSTLQATAELPTRLNDEGADTKEFSVADTETYRPEGSKTAAVLITGTQSNGDMYVFGGENSQTSNTGRTVELDTWIKMTGGDLKLIAGGNNCNNWGGGGAVNFKGDSHIYITQEGEGAAPVVDYIVGGNYKDGKSPTFTGDSYITIASDSLQGGVVGGSLVAHTGTTTFTGDSHIYIYTPQTKLADADLLANSWGAGLTTQNGNFIVGGNVRGTNSSGTLIFKGNTNILLDFASYTGEAATMAKTIIGGSYQPGVSASHSGDTNITIRNAETTTFTQDIIGGSKSGDVALSLDGTAKLDISSGTYTGKIIGGHYASGGNAVRSLWAVEMMLSGGTFKGDIYAAGYLESGSSSSTTTRATTVTIGSGVTLGTADAAIVVSGGFGGDGTGGTVTGQRILNLAGTHAHATFKDFDVVNVAGSDSATITLATGSSFSKTGAGTLAMGSTATAVIVQAGTLDLNGQTLTSVTVAGGATLDATVAGSSVSSLTLGAASGDVANLKLGSNGIALGSLSLTAGTKINLVDVGSVGSNYTYTLFSGLDASRITGITFGGEMGNVATLADYIENASVFAAGELILTEDGKLVITDQGAGGAWEWTNPGGGTWENNSNEGWDNDEVGAKPEDERLVFDDQGIDPNTNKATITISGTVTPDSVVVSPSEGNTYEFAAAADGDGISEGSLTMNGEGTLVISTENSSEKVLSVENGTVQLGTETDAGGWKGAVEVHNTATLDVTNVEGAELGAITAADTATVKLADGTTVSSLSGGKLVAETTDGSTVTISSTSGSFASVENGTGTLVFGADVTMGTLNNETGTITATDKTITISDGTDKGGDITAGGLSVGGNSTLGAVTLTGTLSANNHDITLTESSTIGGSTGIANVQNLAVGKDATLTITGDNLWVNGNMSGDGSVDVTSTAAGKGQLTTVGTLNIGGSASAYSNVNLKGAGHSIGGDLTSDTGAVSIAGAVTVTGTLRSSGMNVDVEGKTTVGGDLSAYYRVQIKGDLTVGGNVSSTDSFVSSTGNVVVGDKDATNGVKGISSKDYVSIAGTADIEGDVTVTDNRIEIAGLATIGGNVEATAGSVTLHQGGTVGGSLTAGKNITLGSAASAVAEGDVTLPTSTSVVGDLTSNDGSISVHGDVTVGTDTLASSLTAKNVVEISGNADVEGDLSATDGYVGITGTADVGGNLSAGMMVDVAGRVTVGGNLSAGLGFISLAQGGTVGGDVEANGTNGGSLTLGGMLGVTGAITELTRINVLGDDLRAVLANNTTALVTVGSLTTDAADAAAPNKNLTFSFANLQSVLSLGLDGKDKDNNSQIILTSTAELPADLELILEASSEAGVAPLADAGVSNSFVHEAVEYTLGVGADGKSIVLTAGYVGCDWESTDGVWNNSTGDWTGNATADVSTNVVFNGKGTETIRIEDSSVAARSILVDTAVTPDGVPAYTFSSDAAATIDTEQLTVKTGSATLAASVSLGTETDPLAEVDVQQGGSLAVNKGASLYAGTLSAAGTFSNAGAAVVSGKMTAGDVENTGSLSIGADSALGILTGAGTLKATGSTTVDGLDGATSVEVTQGVLTVTDADLASGATLKAAGMDSRLEVQNMIVAAKGTTFAVEAGAGASVSLGAGTVSTVTLTSLTGAGSFSTGHNVVLQSAVTAGSLAVNSLDLRTASGSSLASLEVADALTLNVNGLVAGTPLLTLTDDQVAATTIKLSLTGSVATIAEGDSTPGVESIDITAFTWDNIAGLGTTGTDEVQLSDGSMFTRNWTDYLLIDATGSYTWDLTGVDTVTLQQMFASSEAHGYATLDTTGGDLVLKVYKDDPREWTGGDLTGGQDNWAGHESNNGGQVLNLSKINAYDALTTVDVLNITQEATIDLTTDELSNAADAARGLVLNDLAGTAGLTITGDGSSYDVGETIDAMDRVTFSNSKDTVLAGSVSLEDVDAIVESRTEGAGLTVGDLALKGEAALAVQDGASLTTGAATLSGDDASLYNGGTLSTGDVALSGEYAVLDNGGMLTTGDVTLSGTEAQVHNTGTATLGKVTLSGDTASVLNSGTMETGAVVLSGSDAVVYNDAKMETGAVTLSGTNAVLQNASELTTGDVTLSGANASVENSATLAAGAVTLKGDNASVTNDGALTAGDVVLSGANAAFSSTDTLNVGDVTLSGANATLENSGTMEAGKVTLSGAGVTFSAGTATVASLNGALGTIGGNITVTGTEGNYSGSYARGTQVALAAGARQTLAARTGLAVSGNRAEVTLGYAGSATASMDSINVTNTTVTLDNMSGSTMRTLTLAQESSMQKGTLSFGVNTNDIATALSSGTAAPVITNGAAFHLKGTQVVVAQAAGAPTRATFDVSKGTEELTLFTISASGEMEGVSISFGEGDKFFSRYFRNMQVKDGKVVADLVTDYYSSALGRTSNGTAGLSMMDQADLALNPMGATDEAGDKAEYKDLAGVLHALEDYRNGDGSQKADADKLGAAVAGSGVAALGVALAGDVERQLKAVRNRTTTMGVDQSVVNENMPYFNAWINAEGDHREMDDDATLAGYKLDSWGGTVGADVDLTPSLTCGLALTAMYGDFSADVADKVEADVETYYVSAFARATKGAWVHTFVGTLGTSTSDISRTVSHSHGSYHTEGSADGMAFGLLYELGRTFALNEDATACWQPVFNVSYRHTEVDAYTESGSDAALSVGDQSLDTVTFGLGGRFQAVVGENVYNRTSIFEARALAKLDAGDRESEMNVALLNAPLGRASVKSAEVGAVGVELGVGLTVPVGFEAGSIFIDGSVEFRSSYTSANGTLGYRINF